MKLANPIYDTVFKYLMEDTEIARRLLSKIIREEITKIEVLIKKLPKEARSELEQILQIFNQTYILGSDKKFLEIKEEVVKSNDLLELMSGRLKEAATDEKIIEGILVEQEVEEVIDQHIREKEELKEELKERNEQLKEQNKLIEELKKQLKGKK